MKVIKDTSKGSVSMHSYAYQFSAKVTRTRLFVDNDRVLKIVFVKTIICTLKLTAQSLPICHVLEKTGETSV